MGFPDNYRELLWLDQVWQPEALHKHLSEVDGVGIRRPKWTSNGLEEVPLRQDSPEVLGKRAKAYADVIDKILKDQYSTTSNDVAVAIFNQGVKEKIFGKHIANFSSEKIRDVFKKVKGLKHPDFIDPTREEAYQRFLDEHLGKQVLSVSWAGDCCMILAMLLEEPPQGRDKEKAIHLYLEGIRRGIWTTDTITREYRQEALNLLIEKKCNLKNIKKVTYKSFIESEEKLSKKEILFSNSSARASDCSNTIILLLQEPQHVDDIELAKRLYFGFLEECGWTQSDETRASRQAAYNELMKLKCTEIMHPTVEDAYKTFVESENRFREGSIDPGRRAHCLLNLIEKILAACGDNDPKTEKWYKDAVSNAFNEGFPEVWLENGETRNLSLTILERLKESGCPPLVDPEIEESYKNFLERESSYSKGVRDKAYWEMFNTLVLSSKQLGIHIQERYRERAEELYRKATQDEIWGAETPYALDAFKILQPPSSV